MGIIKALSLWQPARASDSARAEVVFETRGWHTKYRGPLAIHAAKKPFRYQEYPMDYYHEVGRQFKEADRRAQTAEGNRSAGVL